MLFRSQLDVAPDQIVLTTNFNGGIDKNQWTFSNIGGLTFPDTTTQYTAYSNAAVSTYLSSTTPQTFGDSVLVGGNLTVQGNIFFNGNASLIATQNLIINDNIIYIANANPGSSLDIGFAGHFTASGFYQHTGDRKSTRLNSSH